jgi:hypothetical protein
MEQRVSAECDVFSGSGNQIKLGQATWQSAKEIRQSPFESRQVVSNQGDLAEKAMTKSSQEEKGSGDAVLNDGICKIEYENVTGDVRYHMGRGRDVS